MATAVGETSMFQCGVCKRHYKRLDHLARHVRSHTQTRPHKCHICSKAFTRTDLLKRHLTSHESRGVDPARPNPASSDQVPPVRVSQACRACASNHLRCSEAKPCTRCVEKKIDCIFVSPDDGPSDADDDDNDDEGDTAMQDDSLPKSDREPTGEATLIEVDPSLGIMETPPRPHAGTQAQYAPMSVDPGTVFSASTASDMFPPPPPVLQDNPVSLPGLDGDYFFSDFPDLRLLSGPWAAAGPLDLGLESATELDDMDLRFLDTYNTSVPFEFRGYHVDGPAAGVARQPANDQDADVDSTNSNDMRAEAYRDFQWRFVPSVHDHGGAEEHNLSLPEAANDKTSPESRISVDRRITCAPLEVATRDRILTLVVKSCRPGNLSRAVSSFPSVELLDSLLQYFLASPFARSDAFLHAPTFDPNQKRPELVAAMAAAGAVLTCDPALTKLGHAIQESVRTAIPSMWEQDNTMVRDLQLSQGFLIALEVALWSGYSRKVEIAESFLQPLLTMLRRDNKFKRSRYTEAPPDPSLHGHQLDEAWRRWVDTECWKRLAFKLMQHDTNSSMALVVNPLVSYAEVQLPLPVSSDLWAAPTAQLWKESYLSRSGFQQPTLIDYLDDPEIISSPGVEADVLLSRQIFLSCAWSLAWEHIQLSAFQRARPRRWNSLVMTTRREELTKLLTHFRISADGPTSAADTELLIRLELILLHLHTPFEDLQTFAGMDGPAQARSVVPAVVEWARGETARRAVWHAGQIVRATRLLPTGAIRGFTAIMVYHASVAFWVYALAAEKPEARRQWGGANGGGGGPGQDVWLDEPDGLALQRFIQLGSGRPCIRGTSDEAVHLSRPDQVMEAVLATLRANFDGGPRPLLVEKLIQLMSGLQRSSRTPGAA